MKVAKYYETKKFLGISFRQCSNIVQIFLGPHSHFIFTYFEVFFCFCHCEIFKILMKNKFRIWWTGIKTNKKKTDFSFHSRFSNELSNTTVGHGVDTFIFTEFDSINNTHRISHLFFLRLSFNRNTESSSGKKKEIKIIWNILFTFAYTGDVKMNACFLSVGVFQPKLFVTSKSEWRCLLATIVHDNSTCLCR